MPIIGVIGSSGDRNVPDAPTIGTATDVGTGRAYNNGAATVTFTAPVYTGGTPITGYTVTSSPGGFTGTGASSPVTVAGLQSSVSYTFTVTATNAVGTSAPSSASNSITATTVPQAPTIGTATAGDTNASVTFTANANGGKTVSTFTATSSPSSITGTSATSPITVSGLTNGTAYTFTVTATNANGTSTASAASNSVTPATPYAFNSISSYLTTTTPTAWNTITTGASFNSIPQTYRHLQLRITGSSNTATNPDQWYLYMNGDFSTRFSEQYISNTGGTPVASGTGSNALNKVQLLPVGNSNANYRDTHILTFFNYTNSARPKVIRYEYFSYLPSGSYTKAYEGMWLNTGTAAISSFQWGSLNGDPVSGCIFALYGIS